ncbi:MAG: MFS transporter [Gemmatales bacterium]|nr:MFS transporter [Gemmatales bacterium]MDW8388012.1 MFS transporter [Gemmatales bacterium]
MRLPPDTARRPMETATMFHEATPGPHADLDAKPWYHLLTRYHWFVLVVAALGWLFDTMDQQLFNLARGPAMAELGGPINAQFAGGLATMIFMLGWATGGVVFGIMGDRFGRAKTMVLTILIYSLFTGLSALSVSFWDFCVYRFITGLGVGGEFAVGVALVAEVMPDRARPHALGWLQASSAFGNISAALVSMGLAPLEAAGALGEYRPWRWMFIVGALPALLALVIRRRLKEPERWQALRNAGSVQLGSLRELFGHPLWRRHAIIGLILATSGVVGLWGIGFFSFDLVRSVFRQTFEAELRQGDEDQTDQDLIRTLLQNPSVLPSVKERIRNPNYLLEPEARAIFRAILTLDKEGKAVTPQSVQAVLEADGRTPESRPPQVDLLAASTEPIRPLDELLGRISQRNKTLESRLTWWAGVNGLLLNIGAFFGIYSFKNLTQAIGRRPAFAVTFLLALGSTVLVFGWLSHFWHVFWMVPLMGFCQIALFGGYAIYFPELFPTHLRSTGTSFCYNVGRYLAAPGPLLLGTLAATVFGSFGEPASWRYAGITMSAFFLLGLAVLPFAPETKGKPLPE